MVDAREHLVSLNKKWWSRRREYASVAGILPSIHNKARFPFLTGPLLEQSISFSFRGSHAQLVCDAAGDRALWADAHGRNFAHRAG